MTTIELPDEGATQRLAERVAGLLETGTVVGLDGPLGAGKTTFTRYLVQALGGDPAQVSSPTYTLRHHYPARVPIVHVDAYRLQGGGGLAGLGFDELRDGGIAIVEWAGLVMAGIDPAGCWRIVLEHCLNGGRQATVTTPPHLAGKWLHEHGAR